MGTKEEEMKLCTSWRAHFAVHLVFFSSISTYTHVLCSMCCTVGLHISLSDSLFLSCLSRDADVFIFIYFNFSFSLLIYLPPCLFLHWVLAGPFAVINLLLRVRALSQPVSINLFMLPARFHAATFHLSIHCTPMSFSFHRWQQRALLPHIQTNTSPADVFNNTPSVFFSHFGCFSVGRGGCFLFLPSHYFCLSAGQWSYPLQLQFLDLSDFIKDQSIVT